MSSYQNFFNIFFSFFFGFSVYVVLFNRPFFLNIFNTYLDRFIDRIFVYNYSEKEADDFWVNKLFKYREVCIKKNMDFLPENSNKR